MKRLSFVFLLAFPNLAHAQMSQGEYVFRVSDCAACHTTPSGEKLAGGVKLPTPFGFIYSTNITPDMKHGIGSWSYNEFVRAVRKGVAKDGHHLYPAMPYPSYVKLSDADMHALYDYIMHEVKPQPTPNRASEISWPLSMRWPLSIWNSMYTPTQRFQPREDKNAQWNRGAYLVQASGHCGTCHTPRGYEMQELSFDESKKSYLSGAELAGWYAPSLRNIPLSKEEIIDLLKKGRSKHKALAGPMDEVISESTQYLTDNDLDAVATYLADIEKTNKNSATPVATQKANVISEETLTNGKFMYMRYCSTCHGVDGKGNDYVIPPLSGNLTVNSKNPQTLIRVILEGGETPATQDHIPYKMPGYRWALSDTEVADVITYIRNNWGNHASIIKREDVVKAKVLIQNNK